MRVDDEDGSRVGGVADPLRRVLIVVVDEIGVPEFLRVFPKVFKGAPAPAVDAVDLHVRPGEFMTLLGTFRVNTWVALFATSGVILSAIVLTAVYVRRANGEFDRLTAEALRSARP